ncbi:MAG: 23S rRNA (guanosine(2251)-2'-O)-methyltransferase RlmB, partial [Eubacteriales bacterium]|nr:23S rRNA (guanosine(2251)-2'-O)-methyltransferase RlmB [Eubacteriales bacterium]
GDRPNRSGDRPSYGDRPNRSGDRPSYGDRPNRSGDRPSYGDRPNRSGDRPSYGDRPNRSGDRPSYGDRPNRSGDRPSYGDRPNRGGDRPSYGERPSYGDRSGSGERPFRKERRDETDFESTPSSAFRSPPPTPTFVRKVAKELPAVPVVSEDAQEDENLEPVAGSPDRLEGRNPIQEALKAGRSFNKLWVAKRDGKPDLILARIVAQSREAGAVVMEVERKILDQMSETKAHQGVIAQVAAHEYVELDDLLASIQAKGETPFLVMLDELQDGYNLGSVLRIADAAGVHGVIIPERRSVGLDSTVAKASAGAIEHVPVCRVGNLTQTVLKLKEQGFWVAGADSEGTQDYHKIDWTGSMLVMIGSEGEGIGKQLLKHCDFLISIPMKGQVNSLNAAVATGIIVFEAAAQRQAGTEK